MDIPKELNFANATDLPMIASGTTTMENIIAPLGTNVFDLAQSGGVCNFDLPNRGYIDPSTIYIKYRYRITNAAPAQIRCTPAYAPIARVDTYVASQLTESLLNYNVYMNKKVQTTMNNSMKYSSAAALGFRNKSNVVTSNSLDGRFIDAGPLASVPANLSEFGVAAPLDFCLSNVRDVFIPVCFLSGLRVALTFDSIQNIFAVVNSITGTTTTTVTGETTQALDAAVLPSTCVLTDVFLCYTSVHFPADVDDLLRRQYAKGMSIRTQSYMIGSAIIPRGISGQIDLQFSHKLSSIRSCFLAISNNAAANGIFEALDITQGGIVGGGGEYSIQVANKIFPNRPHNTSTGAHKMGIMMELRKAISSLYNKDLNMSINTTEFDRILTATPATCSSIADPAKFFVPFRTHVLPSSSVFLSGISAQDSPIGVRIVCNLPTAETSVCNLISVFDMVLLIDVENKTCRTNV